MRIALACDHAGYQLKMIIKQDLLGQGHFIEDCGCFSEQPADYPDFIYPAAQALSEGKVERAILIDGAGYPSGALANVLWNVTAAVANDLVSARLAREHGNANALCLGGQIIGVGVAKEAVRLFLTVEFLGGKYSRRVEKMQKIKERHCKGPADITRKCITLEDIRQALLNKESLIMNNETIVTPSVIDLANGLR